MSRSRLLREPEPDERAEALAPVTYWTPARKFVLLRAVQNGHITMIEARETHALSAEELDNWWRLYQRGGLRGAESGDRPVSPLKPGSIVGAAAADLKLDRRKRAGEADPWLPYSFHRHHVRDAGDTIELIEAALKEPELGAGSGKPCTRVIYGDTDRLAAALRVARERVREGQAA